MTAARHGSRRRSGADLQKLHGLEVDHAAAGAPGGVEQDVRLGGVGIAQDADAEAVDDQIGAAKIAEGDGEFICAAAGRLSSACAGLPRMVATSAAAVGGAQIEAPSASLNFLTAFMVASDINYAAPFRQPDFSA